MSEPETDELALARAAVRYLEREHLAAWGRVEQLERTVAVLRRQAREGRECLGLGVPGSLKLHCAGCPTVAGE